jgi:L-lactate dehydrogenase complex protein LldG
VNDASTDRAARARVLLRVRRALGVEHETPARHEERWRDALLRLARHARGPHPPAGGDSEAGVERFIARATALASSVERIDRLQDVPRAVARWLGGSDEPMQVWPALQLLPWEAAGLRLVEGTAAVGVTDCFCAIAETGTVLLLTGAASPMTAALLPETHVAIVARERIVPTMEDAFALLRRLRPELPRGLHFISGPSRTADIDQTLVMGAHGPCRVHLLVVG